MAYGAAKSYQEDGSVQGNDASVEIDFAGAKDDTPLLEKTLAPPPGSLEEEARTGTKRATWGRLLSLAKPEWALLLVGTVALFGGSAITLMIPAAAGVIVNAVLGTGETAITLEQAVIFLAIAFTIGAVFNAVRATTFTLAGERVVANMRKQLFGSLIKQDTAFYDVTRTGELTNRLSADTTVMQNAVTVNISMGLRYIAQSIGSLFLLFVISWQLTLVMLATVPLVVIGAVCYGLALRNLSKKTQDALARASEVAEESISNIRTVKSFSKEDFEYERYCKEVDESYRLGKLKAFAYGGFSGGATFFILFAFGFVLLYGGYLVVNEQLTAGALTSFLVYTFLVAGALGGMSVLYGDFMKALGASERVFQLMDREPRIRHEGGIVPQSMEGRIIFDNVSFAYPSRPEQQVLKNINLELNPNQVVAVVGPSGGGKTTIANLIEAFYYPNSGAITLDGENLQELSHHWLHEKIGIVSQGPCLFAATIRENIAYGMKDVGMHAIELAAEGANAHEFIQRFPEGYEAMVGERGVRLSGGQKQRIAIARALLKDPRVLLLDEATSDLDSESEHLVQEALDRLMVGRTVLVIAHRLSTVRNADVILVVKNGEIVERGTHDQLMAMQGIYLNLVSRQLH